ncbi:LysR substrate-binding domain-containing protein [Paracandidimonas soli]|uniref:DNA-binding transcriptional LysR family regulator n=1 Tax=Paracandidimonas soli TaxID=1917182 RepID=A0A4R3VC66_9BURK|nr:LysR substrate-binding domain-containing protein [Paracandidimonas soli]TCV02907.1 DNA-binding transcriptional LysR family regulator [Paracandidimonas soli]
METDFLKTLALVAEVGSMAEASRRLSITPAAVAHQIRTIEQDLGMALIVRAGRSVVLTGAGHLVLKQSQTLLADLARLRASVQQSSAGGELRMGVINSALHTFLPDMLGLYQAHHPEVRLHVHAGVSHQIFHQLQEDEIDIAICLHPPFALPKMFGWMPMREEPLVVLAHKSLADQPALDLLRTQPFIRYDRHLGGGKQAAAYLRRHEIVPNENFELDSLVAIALMVDRRLGVSLVPQFSSPLTAPLDIAVVPVPDASSRVFGILWKRASARSALIQDLLAQARGLR